MTTVAVEKQLVLNVMSVCEWVYSCPSYPACNVLAPCYIAICGVSGFFKRV